MSDGYGRRRPGGGGTGGGRRRDRGGGYDDDFDRGEDADFEEDDLEERPPRRGSRRPGPPSRRPAGGSGRGGLFGGGSKGPPARRGGGGSRPSRGGEGFDWSVAEDDDRDEQAYDDDRGEDWEEEDRPRRRAAPGKSRRRMSLMDLCTPVFGYAAILPRDHGGIHPSYQQFRQEVTAALDRIEREAPDHGIEREDAREACYALALFLDEQVADSEWSGKMQWSGEPLNIVRLNDPEGGVNFFEHLEGLGNRQRAVKKVYLVCLALGFRGKFGELDPSQQGPRLGEIRQKVVRSIQEPLEGRTVLFPDGYVSAIPIEVEAATVPRWWLFAGLGATTVLVLLWLVLFWVAGRKPEPAIERLQDVVQESGGMARNENGADAGSHGSAGQ